MSFTRVAPTFILWHIWRWRNIAVHGGSMFKGIVLYKIDLKLQLLTKTRYPWIKDIPQY